MIDLIMREARWIGQTRRANGIDVGRELAEIKDIDADFVERLKGLLQGKFSMIGMKLRELLRPASKGSRKGLMIFVPGAANLIGDINDDFVKYIVRSVYDNFNDIVKGVIFRIHFNELFSGDFIMSIMRELNAKVDELTLKKKEIRDRYFREWSKLCSEKDRFDFMIYVRRRVKDNVFNLPISKPFWDRLDEFKRKIKVEHPRVPDDKMDAYIEKSYSYRGEQEKIVKEFLQTIPEYVDLEKRIKEHFDSEGNENRTIQNAINEELKQLEFDKIKPVLVKMIDNFTGIIARSIAVGNL